MKTTMRRLSWLLLITIVFALLVPISALGEEIELRFMWWGGDARHKATLAAIDRYTSTAGEAPASTPLAIST